MESGAGLCLFERRQIKVGYRKVCSNPLSGHVVFSFPCIDEGRCRNDLYYGISYSIIEYRITSHYGTSSCVIMYCIMGTVEQCAPTCFGSRRFVCVKRKNHVRGPPKIFMGGCFQKRLSKLGVFIRREWCKVDFSGFQIRHIKWNLALVFVRSKDVK